MKQKVLVVAHGHPAFSKGGAEIAAHALFEQLNRSEQFEAWLLAADGTDGLRHTGTAFSAAPGTRQILFAGGTDYFLFSAQHLPHITEDFAGLLRTIQPNVIHFHHYAVVGIEAIRVARNTLPSVRIVLTLHELLAICNNNGQMIKTNGMLCRRSSPAECHVCMPGRSPQDFFLRESYIKSFFRLVDHFIAPSHFLRDRYIAWGLDAASISVIENGQPAGDIAPARDLPDDAPRTRFAYFGQITPYKGVDVLLQAFAALPKGIKKQARLEVFGGGHHVFGDPFESRINDLLKAAHRQVHYQGPYAPEDLERLMSQVDWVIVPSIWWENSPLVIQEAFKHGRPVICSDIGGMAEKVHDGINGLHFRAGSSAALAEIIEHAVVEPGLWERLRSGIVAPPSLADTTAATTALYSNQ